MHLTPYPGDSGAVAPPQAPTRSRTVPRRCGTAPGPFHGRLPQRASTRSPFKIPFSADPACSQHLPAPRLVTDPASPCPQAVRPAQQPLRHCLSSQAQAGSSPFGAGPLAHLWPIKHGPGKRRGAIGQEGCHPRDVTGALPGAG